MTRATGKVTLVPRSTRLPGDSLGALMGLPGSLGTPRNEGSCEDSEVGFESSGLFTPVRALVTDPAEIGPSRDMEEEEEEEGSSFNEADDTKGYPSV